MQSLILKWLVAFPESRRILSYHLLATGLISLQYGVLAMVPVLIRKYFQGGAWPTTLAATAIGFMNLLSISWHEVYRRMDHRRYVLLLWLLAHLPLAGIALAHSAGAVLLCVFLSATGTAGINPLIGDILRSCYPPSVRSKVLGSLQSITQFTIMVSAWAVGLWLDVDHEAFRIYFPISVAVMGGGMWLLSRIGCQPLFVERSRHECLEPLPTSMKAAYRKMLGVLVRDSTFRQYEAGYCAFNFAWWICVALLPLLLADVLRLNYKQVALCSDVPLRLVLLLGTVPVGFAMDRLGPVRMSIWGFALVALYPTGLVLAAGAWHVGAAVVILGISLTAVNLGWTIGPVILARHPAEAPHYLAIHWTLTTLAGVTAQIPAVAYYRSAGDVYSPLKVAVGMFAVASLVMYRLERRRRAAERRMAPPVAVQVVPLTGPPGTQTG